MNVKCPSMVLMPSRDRSSGHRVNIKLKRALGRVHPVALLVHWQWRVQPERACSSSHGTASGGAGGGRLRHADALARQARAGAGHEQGTLKRKKKKKRGKKKRKEERKNEKKLTWRGQIREAEPLLARLPDAIKHGIRNLEIFSFGVEALGHHAAAGSGEGPVARHGGAGAGPPRGVRCVKGSRGQRSPHARRLGGRQPDAAVLHHHTPRRLHAQLLQQAGSRPDTRSCASMPGWAGGCQLPWPRHIPQPGACLMRVRRASPRTTPHLHTHIATTTTPTHAAAGSSSARHDMLLTHTNAAPAPPHGNIHARPRTRTPARAQAHSPAPPGCRCRARASSWARSRLQRRAWRPPPVPPAAPAQCWTRRARWMWSRPPP